MYDFLVRFFEYTKLQDYAKYNYMFTLASAIIIILLPIYYASYSMIVIQIYAVFTLFVCGFYLPFKYYKQIKIYVKTFLLGTLILVITLLNDILIENRIYQGTFLLGYGVIAFIFSLSYSLSIKMTKSFREVVELSESIKKINESIVKFVPTEFISLLGKHNIQEAELGTWTQKDLTILFSDIRSFTSFAEKVTPKECFEFINSYLKQIGPIIRRNEGFIDKYIGDGIMALFPQKVENALNAAIEMQREVLKINDIRKQEGKEEFKIGIGIHKGTSVIGIVGEEQRTESTVIADAVNLASRIESLTKDFSTEILISTDAFLELENPFEYEFRFLGKVQVKGKSKFVGIVEILNSLPQSKIEKILQSKTLFEEALGYYDSGQFSIAKTKFEEVQKQNPSDFAAWYYLNKITVYEKSFFIHENEQACALNWIV